METFFYYSPKKTNFKCHIFRENTSIKRRNQQKKKKTDYNDGYSL